MVLFEFAIFVIMIEINMHETISKEIKRRPSYLLYKSQDASINVLASGASALTIHEPRHGAHTECLKSFFGPEGGPPRASFGP